MKIDTKIIENCKKIIITPKTINSIESLYIGGTINPQDRIEKSDIDLIGIVHDSFPELLEKKINLELKRKIKTIECKLRNIYISELKGGKQKGYITKLLPVELFIRRFPYFLLIWGIEIDMNTIIKPYSYIEEAKVYIKLIRNYISKQTAKESFIPFEWIPKSVLYLSSIELVIDYDNKYMTSFTKIQNALKRESNHIVHKSMEIRCKSYNISDKEKYDYLKLLQNHIDYLEYRYSKN